MKKRWLSLALALCMVLTLLPVSTFAADIVASGECGAQGENVTWTLDRDGLLTISGSGEMKYSYNAPWYHYYRDSIKSVIVANGVTNIASNAFMSCTNLISATLPGSVASIGNYAFYNCFSLSSISIPYGVTSLGNLVFSGCSSLASITLPDSVISIGECTFQSCDSLTSVKIPDSVTNIGIGAFQGCGNLAEVTLGDHVTSIENSAFGGCGSLLSMEIPASVTQIGVQVFSGCNHLTSIHVSDDNSSYASIDGVLFNKSFTEIIAFPGAKGGHYMIPDSVSNIGLAFQLCRNLTSITIPGSVTNIEKEAFYLCSSLRSITIPNSIQSIRSAAFRSCSSLKDVYFTGSQEEWNAITIESNNDPLLGAQIHFIRPIPFADVPDGKYYTDAVLWAVAHDPQITNGYSDGTFRPDQVCTRAQVVTFLWRAAGEPEPKIALNPFTDVSKSAYYYKAVLWAVEKGITTGKNATTFDPTGECTRAHVVTFLWRANGSPNPTSSTNPFKDVPAGKYYAKAVLWALENGVTTGKTANTFNPDGECTRAHVVTFLYRDMA